MLANSLASHFSLHDRSYFRNILWYGTLRNEDKSALNSLAFANSWLRYISGWTVPFAYSCTWKISKYCLHVWLKHVWKTFSSILLMVALVSGVNLVFSPNVKMVHEQVMSGSFSTVAKWIAICPWLLAYVLSSSVCLQTGICAV